MQNGSATSLLGFGLQRFYLAVDGKPPLPGDSIMTNSLIAAFAATCLVAPALGQTPSTRSQPVQVVVPAADLDLNTARDVTRLDRRIHRAAAAACGSVSTLDLVGRNVAARCIAATATAMRPQRDRLVAQARSAQVARR